MSINTDQFIKEIWNELDLKEYNLTSTPTITWHENVNSWISEAIKRTLRQYGYPPDMQKLATDTVLKQAEMIAKEITH